MIISIVLGCERILASDNNRYKSKLEYQNDKFLTYPIIDQEPSPPQS